MCLESVLEYFQVHVRSGEFMWFWSLLGCITAQRKSGTCEDTKICSFTQDWYVCLARGSILRYEGVSIDTDPLVSLDTNVRMGRVYFKTDLGHNSPQITRMPLTDLKPYLCVYLSYCLGYVLYSIILGFLLG